MKRLLLILYGYTAVRTQPLSEEVLRLRRGDWLRIFGELAEIRTEAA